VTLLCVLQNTMGRRKRTREELEEARRENESVNATPAAAEDPTAKRRRQVRRSNKRRNITKALEAMSIIEGECTTAVLTESAVTVPPICSYNCIGVSTRQCYGCRPSYD
jgi:hypothetical protein